MNSTGLVGSAITRALIGRGQSVIGINRKVVDLLDPWRRALWTSSRFRARGMQREMAGRERTRRRTALVVRWVKSASFRMNPQKHGATRAIAQEKTPTQTSWGFGIGGKQEYENAC